ncbi:MAG: MBL fold metallo-hydrolase, partial [Acidimicrobiales bacterium]
MPELPESVFANRPETRLFEDADADSTVVNHVLLGTYLGVLDEVDGFYEVVTRRAGRGGFVAKGETRPDPVLKMFFVDVGQGDGTLIESPQGIVVVDGGIGGGFRSFLRHRYKPLIDDGEQIEIAAMVVSHPDGDHYKGLEYLLEDPDFKVKTIYHNGLMRYPRSVEDSKSRMITEGHLVERDIDGKSAPVVVDIVDGLDGILDRLDEMPAWFRWFWEAAKKAREDSRLTDVRRLSAGDTVEGFSGDPADGLHISVLAPVPLAGPNGEPELLAFGEPKKRHLPRPAYPHYHYSHSHTRNGQSIMLRLDYGQHRILLG